MRILVTGGSGYLGAHLVPMLLDAGHEVTVLDSFMFGNDTTLGNCCSNPEFDIYRVDCRDISAVKPFLAKADCIIPLAALVGAPICNMLPIDADRLNRVHMHELINNLSPDQIVIFPSTESVYGRQPELCDETTEPGPLVTYGTQKLEIERALEARGMAISFRMATLFGFSTRMRCDLLINDFVFRAVRDNSLVVYEGSAMRTCLHVIDAARAFVHCLDIVKKKHEVLNVGSIFVSKISLCESIQKYVPKFYYTEAQFAADPDARNYTVSDAKIRATGFEPTMTLDAGIVELIKGYRGLANSRHSNMP